MAINAEKLKELGFMLMEGRWTLPAFAPPQQPRIPPALWPAPDEFAMGRRLWDWGEMWGAHFADGRMVKEKLGGLGQHTGDDWPCPVGTPIRAPCDGSVLDAGWQDPEDHKAGLGIRVKLEARGRQFAGLGYLIACVGHLSRLAVIHGEELRAGDLVGFSGETGHASGPHVHATFLSGGVPLTVKYLKLSQYQEAMANV